MWIWPNMSNERKFYERWRWRARKPDGNYDGGITMTWLGARYRAWKIGR